MFFKKCCFLIPLNYGCYIIGALFLSFHVGELITHTKDTIFISNVTQRSWGAVVMAPILMAGTLVSVLLIYGAAKRKRGFVLLWVITNVITLVLYIILYIVSFVKGTPTPIIIAVQSIIIFGLIYSLLIVHSFYLYLKTVEQSDII
ncbi:hypothetical protein KR032_010592 [Drosophila birchii]|nr:hypothetical protein KR032_010592 [Drosophila birchii]